MNWDEQHPRVRATTICIECSQPKDVGLVLCWTCHHKLKRQFNGGYGAFMQLRLQSQEAALKAFGKPEWRPEQ